MAEVNRRLEVAKEKLKAVKEVEARADAIEKELAAEEDAKKKEIEEKLKVGDEREDALVASEVGDEEIINDGVAAQVREHLAETLQQETE